MHTYNNYKSDVKSVPIYKMNGILYFAPQV